MLNDDVNVAINEAKSSISQASSLATRNVHKRALDVMKVGFCRVLYQYFKHWKVLKDEKKRILLKNTK
jgi:hypothetical protein